MCMGWRSRYLDRDILRVVQYTQTESDRLRHYTARLTGSQVVRDLKNMVGGF